MGAAEVEGCDADEGSSSGEHIATRTGRMLYAASTAAGIASRVGGSDHGRGLGRQYDTRIRWNLPGIVYPG